MGANKPDWIGAVTSYQRALQCPSVGERLLHKGSVLTSLATAKREAGMDLNDALRDAEESMRLVPDYEFAYVEKAKILRELGRAEEELHTLRQCITINCSNDAANIRMFEICKVDEKHMWW